jgi:excinuclease ABC subunit C
LEWKRKKTKEKETLESFLDRIKGIGPKRKEVLLKNFKRILKAWKKF